MVSRIRRAWSALKDAVKDAEKERARGSDDLDLDAPLPKAYLHAAMLQFWRRYKMSYPPGVDPSDSVNSRLMRELPPPAPPRLADLKVGNQMHQLTSERKQTQAALHVVYACRRIAGRAIRPSILP